MKLENGDMPQDGGVELCPVVSAGFYRCEAIGCKVIQWEDSITDVLYYGIDDGMYCIEHIAQNS